MMPLRLNSQAPWKELRKNPYAFQDVFSRYKDMEVIFTKEKSENDMVVLIFEKKFDETAELSFVMCVGDDLDKTGLRKLIQIYKKFVSSLPSRNFRQVEPIIIAKGFESEAIAIIEEYNSNYEKRKPFRLFTYGKNA